MGDLNCYFHKNRTAASKCDDCGRYICLECQYESSESRGNTSVRTKICPYCKADKIEDKSGAIIGVFACFAFIVFSLIMVAATEGFGGDLSGDGVGIAIFFVIFVIAIILFTFIAAVNNKEKKPNPEAEAIRAKARKALEKSKNIKSHEDKHTPLYCKFCGAPIEANEKSCQYCGMKWIWLQDKDSP